MVKNLPAVQETWLCFLGQEDLLEKGWLPTPVLLPGEFHRQRRLAGYGLWGREESDIIEWLTLPRHFIGLTGLPTQNVHGSSFL